MSLSNRISHLLFGDTLPTKPNNSGIRGVTSVNYNFPDETLGDDFELLDRIFIRNLDDSLRTKAFERTIAGPIITKEVSDAIAPGFTLDNPDTNIDPETGPTKTYTKVFNDLIKAPLTIALILAKTYGTSYLMVVYKENELTANVSTEVSESAKPTRLRPISKTWITGTKYKIEGDSSSGISQLTLDEKLFGKEYSVHISRLITIENSDINLTSTSLQSGSMIDRIYDLAVSESAMIYGSSTAYWRLAAGLLKVKMPNDINDDDETEVINAMANLNAKTVITETEGYEVSFVDSIKGIVDPSPFHEVLIRALSSRTGIPKSILYGLSTGAVTGSELDRNNYVEHEITIQAWIEPYIKSLLELFSDFNNESYSFKFNTPRFETKLEVLKQNKLQADIDNTNITSGTQTQNEIRERDGKEELTQSDIDLLLQLKATKIPEAESITKSLN